MHFEWDTAKAAANLRKHGVSFDEASTVFADVLSATAHDPDHSRGESRLLTFGISGAGRVLVVFTPIAAQSFELSVHVQQRCMKGKFMKKPEKDTDEMRAEYRRDDLGTLVRGKYAARYAKATNVVVIDDELTKAFPNTQAVNEALRSLLSVATRLTGRSTRTTRKRVAG